MADKDKADKLINNLDELLSTFHFEALDTLVERNQNEVSRVDNSIDQQLWTDLRDIRDRFNSVQILVGVYKRRSA